MSVDEQKINDLQALIRQDAERNAKRNRIITGVYAVLSVFVVGYIVFAMDQFNWLSKEENVAALVSSYTTEYVLPNAKPRIGEYMVNTVPILAERTMQHLQSNMPQLREKLTGQSLDFIEKQIDVIYAETEQSFDTLMDTHDEEIKDAIGSLESEKGKEELNALIVELLQEQYEQEAHQYASYVKDTVEGYRQYTQHLLLTPREELSDEDKQERDVMLLMLANLRSLARGDYGISLMQNVSGNLNGLFSK